MKVAVIGGGAAGFFAALTAKEMDPESEVMLFEKTAKLLSKVRISGGGRCNVTHACFDPRQLVRNYPRGEKELLGPFYRFQPRDTVEWFQARGVELKTESDGRMFPITDSSQTIIDCFLDEARNLGVDIFTQVKLKGIQKLENGFQLDMGEKTLFVDRLILATGSAKAGWDFAKELGHTVEAPVPSLFTFNIPKFSLVDLAGVAVPSARLCLEGSKLEQQGPLLITHWGFSGPAALKLSAWGARFLAEKKYQAHLRIDWIFDHSEQELRDYLQEQRVSNPNKHLGTLRMFSLPKKLWKALCERGGLSLSQPLSTLGKSAVSKLCEVLKRDRYEVSGKTTNKEEFVTCGGVVLSEVQFKTMESKCCSGLFFCGEILNIDGVTGGFNFQNAWTSAWTAGCSAVQ